MVMRGKATPPPRPQLTWGEPEARIEQISRFVWSVTIHHGVMRYGPGYGGGWECLGHRAAERKARRELARYIRREERKASYQPPTIITDTGAHP